MATDKQISANQKNAQLSTGPKETEKTKFNAVKHGILSATLITNEEKDAFQQILQDLIEDFNPKTKMELILLEKIASALFDSQRIYNKESIFDNNESIKSQLAELREAMFAMLETERVTDIQKYNELKEKLLCLVMPQTDFSRYKNEADNRFYKALKALGELRK